MSFASILQLIQGRVMAASTAEFYLDKNIEAPSDVIPWENNPTQWDESGENPQPPRPYLAVEWGDIPLAQEGGFLSGHGEFTIKVVVDNFHQGRDSSEDKADYVTQLQYADHITDLLARYQGIEVLGLQRPVFATKKNILIIGIRCRIESKRPAPRIAWKPSV